MYLRFNVESQHLARTDRSIVVARSENYLKAKFDFSPDWDGVTKTGVFTNGGRVYNVILDNDECFVPTEVIRKGCFTVSVFGGDLITADVVTIRVEPSGYEIGGSPEPPTPEVYEQVLGMFDKFRGGEEGQVLSKSSDEDLEFEWVDQGGGGTAPRWGNITGTLSNQEDLQAALDAKENAEDAFSGDYYDLTNRPELFSGDYNDLSNKPTIPEAVTANPTLAGTEANLEGLQIGNTKFKVPTGGGGSGTEVIANPTLSGEETELTGLQVGNAKFKVATIDDANASQNSTYSSEKIDTIANSKLDSSLATISGGAENLFDITASKSNWKPATTTGATYSDGAEATNTYTTNLIPANKTDKAKFKFNMTTAPSYYRTFLYNDEQVWRGGANNLELDEDGYYYIDLSSVSASGFTQMCLVFTTTDSNVFTNLVITDYDSFGDAKTIINDLYLSDDNVEMAKERLGILSDNVLKGKKWAVAGDSFTEGGWASGQAPLISSGKYAGQKAVYPYLIGNRNDMTIQNIFKAGRTLAHPSDDSFTNTFADNYQDVAADADYLTIYLGINDSHHRPNAYGSDGEDTTGEITLGTITDNTTATYYGAWNVILTWLITNRPNLKIGIIATNGAEIDDYRTATIAIAQKYGIPYIDLNGDERTPCMLRSTNASIDSDVRSLRTANWRIDSSNSHPNAACHEYEATFIEAFLRTL